MTTRADFTKAALRIKESVDGKINLTQLADLMSFSYNKALGDVAELTKNDPWGEVNEVEILSLKID